MDRVAVAFSGGADSSFLLRLLRDAHGRGNVLAVTVWSEFAPKAEIDEAARFVRSLGVKHSVVKVKLLSDPKIKANTPLRCYYCKKRIFAAIKKEAARNGYNVVVDASNRDDRKDYRPGRLALKELGILSPLESAGMTKADIRALSKKIGLSTWDKPANACLATRISTGEPITAEKLDSIDAAESILRKAAGLKMVRVRRHGDIARIEVPCADIKKLLGMSAHIIKKLNSFGFRHVTVDLQGYRTGSMNARKK
ncbi:MAG: ATP-dependent sacrificial sulfur transferase LarE [Candidatus Omnitrophota bacterium]